MPGGTRKRPAWLAEAAAREGAERTTPNGGKGADGEAVTGRLPRAGSTDAAEPRPGVADAPSATGGAGERGEVRGLSDQTDSAIGNLSWGTRRRFLAAGLAVLVLLIVLYGLRTLPLFGEVGDSSRGAAPAAPSSAVEDTGVVFGALKTDGGAATLEGAGLKWEGEVEAGEAGETVTLQGPTAVQIRRGFELPDSSIQSGVFAVAQDEAGGEVLHVSFHTFEAGEEEVTQGSIFAVEDDRLGFTGYYRDEREPGSEEVVRTYMPRGGESYRVSFEAPEGTPVPLLVGFKGPSS